MKNIIDKDVTKMTVNERLRYLRKYLLKYKSADDFAKTINLSGSNFRAIEIGNINLTERVIINICKTHNINKQWLLNGTGDYKTNEISALETIQQEYKLSDKEKTVISNYLRMDNEQRAIFTDMLLQIADISAEEKEE